MSKPATSFAWLLSLIAAGVSVAGPRPGHSQSPRDAHRKAAPVHHFVEDPVSELIADIPDLAQLRPADDQDSLPMILSNVGRRVEAFARSATAVSAHEEVTQQILKADGKVFRKRESAFNYIILSHREAGDEYFEEYRTDLKGQRTYQAGLEDGYMITSTFAATCLSFDIDNQGDSTFRYLGMDTVDSADAYVVAFAQDPTLARMATTIAEGNVVRKAYVQGIAWIGKENFQILRLRTDPLAPIPEIGLMNQTTDVRFGEVHPEGTNTPLWLPQLVTVSVIRRGERVRNLHRYSDYRMFRVAIQIKPAPN